MTNTTNYGLKKPAQSDYYNVDDFNYNADVIDTQLKSQADNHSAHAAAAMPHIFTDGGVLYRWGLSVVGGVLMFNYEEVE